MSPSPRGIRPEQIRPIPDVIEYEETTAFALDLMDGDGIGYLPVVSPGTGKLLGMVDRAELEQRCLGFHDPDRCVVRNHLRSDVPYCFDAEPLDGDMLERAEREPVVVVDSHLRPLGFLQDGAGARGSIVAIDGNPDSRDICEALLTRNGYAVTTAGAVDEVASRLTRRPPDLVLMDPGGEADIVRRLVDLTRGSADPVPILVVTTWVDRASQEAVMEAGADRLLAKPVTGEALEAAIEEILALPEAGEPEAEAPGGARIVVVDDDDRVRQMMAGLLRAEGYRVRTARHGSDGVALAADWHPDLILMDLVMPVLDGWNARRLLARGKSTAHIPVLLVTGSCELRERDAVRAEGFVDLVRKPFTPDELLAAVAEALEEAPARPRISHRRPRIRTDVPPIVSEPGGSPSGPSPRARLEAPLRADRRSRQREAG